ncbi:cytochrome c [Pseudomonas sp. NCCP-436]|uniref:cytochrome c n=1 Tax=Pseudomonas sp. NCCP-436 TaxID=2842481 RepID=UPI001C7EA999|nr:cytochrome c [Pseudomonas sp. NCCP-436]GIZ12814.1 alcohol dehydrogenase [Pseudomonas sp. NCCP-436]
MRVLASVALLGLLPLASYGADGEYLARAGDCTACHTAPGGQFMAGGVPFDTPIGRIYSTNITPDKEHGIGAYSFEQFNRAMREGVAASGHALYPAMPYTSYARLSESDMRALYDYFMQQVPAQPVANRDSDIPWPLSMRWPLHVWRWMFHDDAPFEPAAGQSEAYNRGAYLVEGLGHCGACHTPRGWAMQEKAQNAASEQFLAGADLDGWWASNLREAHFSAEDLAQLLKTGRSAHYSVSGPMADVISHSTQYLTDEDRAAIGEYLVAIADQPVSQTANTASSREAGQAAAGTYASLCSVCHGREGEGVEFVVPALAGNPTVIAQDPNSLLQVLLNGTHSPRTEEQMGYAMPGYGWRMDDSQLAELANYLRGQWGNQAAAVSASQVAALRGQQRAH